MESPVPQHKPTYMSFSDALEQISSGNKVTRLEWGSDDEYIYLKDDNLSIHHADGKDYIFQVRGVDILGQDYIVLPSQN